MKIKFSVIIPVYNAEKTLDRCIKSVLYEKRNDIEIILINDGSTDHSADICRKFASDFPQCHMIDKDNGGVSSARNAGIEVASGKYLLFVDSDDFVSKSCFSIIDQQLGPEGYDYLVFSAWEISGSRKKPLYREEYIANEEIVLYEKIRELLCTKAINAPWAKLYRRDIVEQFKIRFPENIYIGEDRIFNIAYSLHIRSMKISDKAIYCEDLQNLNSLSRSQHADLYEQFHRSTLALDNLLSDSTLEFWKKTYYIQAEEYAKYTEVYSEAKRMHIAGKKMKYRYQFLRKQCKELAVCDYWYPSGKFSKFIVFTIKKKMIPVIDLAGMYLAHQ